MSFSAEMGPRGNKKDRYLVIFFQQIPFFYLQGSFFSFRLRGNFFPLTFNPDFFLCGKKFFCGVLQNVTEHLSCRIYFAKVCRNWIYSEVLYVRYLLLTLWKTGLCRIRFPSTDLCYPNYVPKITGVINVLPLLILSCNWKQ